MYREDRAFQVRWDEYKTIQDKIDRIGDFRFRLRGWLVTLITAATGAGALSAKLRPGVFLLGVIAVFAFQRLEAMQSRWERALGNRAAALEAELRRVYGAPGIVSALALARNAARQRKIIGHLLVADRPMFYGLMYIATAIGLFSAIDRSGAIDLLVRSSTGLLQSIKAVFER